MAGTDAYSQERGLYGGSLSCCIPRNAADISDIRQVPDNQEVFCNEKTDQSIIFDILEFQDHVEGENSIRFHFDEIAQSNSAKEESEVVYIERIPSTDLSMTQCSEAWFLMGRQAVAKFNETSKNIVNLYLGLFRLPQFQTDIIVTMNDPVVLSEQSSSFVEPSQDAAQVTTWSLQTFKGCLTTLRIHDQSLFQT